MIAPVVSQRREKRSVRPPINSPHNAKNNPNDGPISQLICSSLNPICAWIGLTIMVMICRSMKAST